MIDSRSPSSSSSAHSVPVPAIYHVHCFETTFDLEQPGAFGRIYPAPPPSSSSTFTKTRSAELDDVARALVNAWKLQRRREGLESAAGPDGGIRISSAGSCACSVARENSPPVSAPRKVGEKRTNLVLEVEAEERKRAKYYTSDDGYGPRGPNSLRRSTQVVPNSDSLGIRRPALSERSHMDMVSPNLNPCGCRPSSKHVQQNIGLSHLPFNLSDALQRLNVIDRTR